MVLASRDLKLMERELQLRSDPVVPMIEFNIAGNR